MSEENKEHLFLEGNKNSSAAAAGAAPAEPPAASSDVRSKKGVSSDIPTEKELPGPASASPALPPSEAKTLSEKVIDEALKKCFDPEIPVNIYELGLIYSVDVSPDASVHVKMTLTAPACPVAGTLPGEVEAKIKAVPGVKDAKVELVWDPPWTAEMMSRVAKVMLGM